MCLVTSQSEPLIAKKDIVVYKCLIKQATTLVSPYIGFVYKLRTLYEASLGVTIHNDITVIAEGFHAYYDKKKSLHKWNNEVYKCIVPKGSKYYLSKKDGEIVSDKLIIKRKLLFNRF